MKVCITGGSGLVGKSIKNIINEKKYEFIFLNSQEYDLRIYESVDKMFNEIKPEIVIHLAAKVGGLYANIDNNYTMLIDNVKINTNILECCKKYKIKRLINMLSTCVFGNNLNYPLTSNQMYDKNPDNSNEGYSISKRLLDTGSRLLTECSDIEIINLIPTNIYGLDDNFNLYNSHVLPALVHKTFIAKKNSESLVIKGSGKSQRQFIFANDLAEIILHFVNCPLNKRFNQLIVGPSIEDEITIKELVNKIVKEFEFKGNIIYDKVSNEGQMKKTVDSSELLCFMPYFKFTSLDDGLKKTIDYFIKNYDNLRT